MKINGEVEGNVPHIIQTRMPRTRREAEHSRGLLRAACRGNGTPLDCLNNRSEYSSFRGHAPASSCIAPSTIAEEPTPRRRGRTMAPAGCAIAGPLWPEDPRLTWGGIGNGVYDLLTIFWDSLRRRPISTQPVAAEVECKWETE